jgi:hypothetical protein
MGDPELNFGRKPPSGMLNPILNLRMTSLPTKVACDCNDEFLHELGPGKQEIRHLLYVIAKEFLMQEGYEN